MVLTLENLLYLLNELGLLFTLSLVRLLSLLNLGNLRLRFWLLNCLRSFRSSRVVRFSRGHFQFLIEPSTLLAMSVLSVLVGSMGASASHGFGSNTVARALHLGLSNVPCVLGSCMHGESFAVIAHILLVHGRYV